MNINLQLVGCLLLFLGMSHFSLAQEAQVRGKVTEEGMALPGVSILVKGTTQGTTSDIDGEYKLNVAPSSILVFSFIGYATQEVNVGDRSEINVVMIPDFTTLDDVVVVGYGTVKKSDLTGSVSSVKNEEINAFPAANVMQALSGRASGVQVKQNTGAPGAPVSVRIRGTNSIQGSNEPLYVIDGFPYTGSNPTIVSNNDIESMEILKDASATAIYGSRGANGVIIITTKRGKAGKTTVDFETSYGVQTIRKKLDLMNAEEYMQFYNEQAVNDNLAPYFSQQEIDNAGEGYDWQDLVFTNAPIKNTNFSVNGGSDKTQFSVSGTVFDQEGIIKGSSYKKYSIRAYFSQNINKMLSLDYGATLTKNSIETRNSSGGNRGGSMIGGAISAPPTLTPYNDDGSYTVLATAYPFISNVLINPLNQINEQTSESEANIVLANAALNFMPIEGLTLRIYGGVENNDSRSNNYTTLNYINSQGSASVSSSRNLSLLSENTLTYSKVFADRHSLTALIGATYQDFSSEFLNGSGTGFLSDITESYDLGSAENPGIPGTGYSYSVLISYLARVNYSLDNKYLFTASMRTDGSSKYSDGNKWGYFPSAAFAWKVKEENFLKDVSAISELKFRTSFGYTGSQAIGAYATLNQLNSGKTVFGDALYNTFAPGTTLPGNLRWETTQQADVGFDIGFMQNRLILTVDAYIKNTKDLLNTVQLPSSLGFVRTIQNVGEIQNKGLELTADALIFDSDFKWNVNANISFNRTNVVKLYGGQDILGGSVNVTFINDNTSLLREGEQMSVFFGYMNDGYDENGKEIYKDLSGAEGVPDGLINQFDKAIIGNPNPDFYYGINSVMSYKNFDLSLFIQGSQGNDIVNVSAIGNTLDYGFGLNMLKEVYDDHWTPENADAKYPVITRNLNMRYSDRLVEDGSFVRLRNIQLAYNLPVQNLGIDWLRNLQIYGSGQNLLTLTKYSWWDPEVNSQGGSNAIGQGIDHYSYPTAKSITFGIKVGL
ncbi:TonB-dependent receptor [uncultured Algoriphagus sp.]|uniref:SusC/RagA family TonB-linked outer membrane protein n=1 Tax=uncultured Algoriphagus sp. TaxID=417365 RepID=UPI0030EE7EA5|tara:strand:- start:16696 stop:19695 length:3000 start_codon:yes stop_codon:yes gene_type:complete